MPPGYSSSSACVTVVAQIGGLSFFIAARARECQRTFISLLGLDLVVFLSWDKASSGKGLRSVAPALRAFLRRWTTMP